MFGLMTPPSKCTTNENKLYSQHRMHYCGVCKTIGQHYGQSARGMLNFDAVFLGELLSLLIEDDTTQWQDALQQVNMCWKMPNQASQDSIALKYAATANVLLGELKIKDHISDNGKKRWKWLHRYFSKSFKKAKEQLDEWNVDTNKIVHIATSQEHLEKECYNKTSLSEFLNHFADATAQITAQIFEGGANIIDKKECASKLYDLGYVYGKLAYVLDAFEDLEQDIYNQEFNPIALFANGKAISNNLLEEVRGLILQYQDEVKQLIGELPIAIAYQTSFSMRLESKIALEIYKERPPQQENKKTVVQQLQQRWNLAQETATKLLCEPNQGLFKLKYYMVVLAVFVSPTVSEQVLPVDSKGMVFSWMALMTTFLGALGLGLHLNSPRERNKRLLKKAERAKEREKRKQLRKEKGWFYSVRKNCIEDCCNTFAEILFLIFYFGAAAYAGIGTILGLIGFWVGTPWGAIFLIVALLVALLVAGFGFLAEFFHNIITKESALIIALVLSILVVVASIIAIIVGAIALMSLFNPIILAVVIIAAITIIALILMFAFSEYMETFC